MRTQLRLATYHIRRHPLRSIIVLMLIMIPVTGLAIGIQAYGRTGANQRAAVESQFGQANSFYAPITSDDATDEGGSTDAATGFRTVTSRSGTLAVATGEDERGGQSVELLRWEQVDLTDPLMQGRTVMTEGRLPRAPGEALVVGDLPSPVDGSDTKLPVALPDMDLRVVGHAKRIAPETFAITSQPNLFVAPGTMPAETDPIWQPGVGSSGTYLFTDDPFPTDATSTDTTEIGRRSDFDPEPLPAYVVAVIIGAATLAFIWCGAIASSALAIGSRRRRREVGLLALNGAPPRWLRRSIAAEGVVLGCVGAIIGMAVGYVASMTILDYPHPSRLLLAAGAMGAVSAAVAGYMAARGVTRQSPADLLAGRNPAFGSAPRWFGVGTAAAVMAVVLAILTGRQDEAPQGAVDLAIVVGMVICGVIAIIALSTGAIRVLPRMMTRAPMSLRIASRDLARFGARTAAASAAVALTLTVATGASVIEYANDQLNGQDTRSLVGDGELREDLGLVLNSRSSRLVDGRLINSEISYDGLIPSQFARMKALAEPIGATVQNLNVVAGVIGPNGTEPAVQFCAENLTEQLDGIGYGGMAPDGCLSAMALEATNPVLDGLPRTTRDSLSNGEAVVWVQDFGDMLPDGLIESIDNPQLVANGPDRQHVPIHGLVDNDDVRGDLGGILQDTHEMVIAIVPSELWSGPLAGHGSPMTTLTALDVDPQEWNALVDEAAAITDYYYWSGSSEPTSDWTFGRVAIVAGIFIAIVLGILALTLVLIRIESRQDERTLVTQGAGPRTMAAISAWRAGVLTFVGALPALSITTLVTLSIATSSSYRPYPRPIAAVLILLGVPLLAAGLFGLSGLRTRSQWDMS